MAGLAHAESLSELALQKKNLPLLALGIDIGVHAHINYQKLPHWFLLSTRYRCFLTETS